MGVDPSVPSTITSFPPGYIDKDKEVGAEGGLWVLGRAGCQVRVLGMLGCKMSLPGIVWSPGCRAWAQLLLGCVCR